MKALTLYQPWASLVVLGEKRIETRSWPTRHVGTFAIHASGSFPPGFFDLCDQPYFKEALERHGLAPGRLPTAAILGTVDLIACLSSTRILTDGVGDKEQSFGDYGPGRFGFLLKSARALSTPVPCKGKLFFWDVPDDVVGRMS